MDPQMQDQQGPLVGGAVAKNDAVAPAAAASTSKRKTPAGSSGKEKRRRVTAASADAVNDDLAAIVNGQRPTPHADDQYPAPTAAGQAVAGPSNPPKAKKSSRSKRGPVTPKDTERNRYNYLINSFFATASTLCAHTDCLLVTMVTRPGVNPAHMQANAPFEGIRIFLSESLGGPPLPSTLTEATKITADVYQRERNNPDFVTSVDSTEDWLQKYAPNLHLAEVIDAIAKKRVEINSRSKEGEEEVVMAEDLGELTAEEVKLIQRHREEMAQQAGDTA